MARRRKTSRAKAMEAPATREMLPAERRERIVAALADQRVVRVPTLSEDLGVSEITIRRDLLMLEQEGSLERTYGGAVIRKQKQLSPVMWCKS